MSQSPPRDCDEKDASRLYSGSPLRKTAAWQKTAAWRNPPRP
jgi:hypothetical protein